MPKQRTLRDLYVIGKKVTLADDEGEVSFWLQKLNPIENEKALRLANAKRAAVLAAGKDENSEESMIAEASVAGLDREQLVEQLVNEEVSKKVSSMEDELAAEKEWSEHDYLQGLRDGWVNGLRDEYARNPEDPEAKRVFDELKRFSDLMDAKVEEERLDLTGFHADADEETLREKVLKQRIEFEGDYAWMREYHNCEIWLSVRELHDHKKYMFPERNEIDDLQDEVIKFLRAQYQALTVETMEGKDSRATTTSSESSESPEPKETESDSTPAESST